MFENVRKALARAIRPKPAAKSPRVSRHPPLTKGGRGDFVQTRMYQAARASRLTSGWATSTTSADSEAVSSLTNLRNRSRALVRDAAYAKRAKVIVQNNVIGAGIGMQAQVMSSRDALREDVNDAIEEAWREWVCAEYCHTGGTLHFCDLERALMGQIFEAGEVLVRKHNRAFGGSAIPFALELIESERIADELQYPTPPGPAAPGAIIKMGVEQDRYGRPLAYWIRQRHPGEFRWASSEPDLVERVPADQIIHLRLVDRWPQTRGEPWLHAVARKLNDMDGLSESEIVAARGAANYLNTIETPEGDHPLATPADPSNPQGEKEIVTEPGMSLRLAPGEKMNFNNPNRPNTALDPFMRMMLREVAAGTGVSYESLSRDYCVAPDTRVLRADLRWVRADELIEGTEIVAFDEEAPGGKGSRRKWRKATVMRTGRRNLNRRRIVTDGATVTVSDEHLFLCALRAPSGAARGHGIQARSESPGVPGNGQRWVRADRLQPGDQIVFLCAPWATGSTHLHGYLKGIADGEGWVDSASAQIGIAQKPGVVLDEIGEALAALGFAAQLGFASGERRTMKWSVTSIGECLKFLGEVRPTRLLQKADGIYDGRMLAGGSKKTGRPTAATVLAIDDVGVGPVVTIETSTRTLITEGLCSHNSQSNYSSSRLALLDDRDLWRMLQQWFLRNFRLPLHREWMQIAVLARAIQPARVEEYALDPRKFEAVLFKPRGWSWIDPAKEVAAYKEAIKGGFKTVSDVISETGGGQDVEDMVRQRRRELDMFEQAELVFDTSPEVYVVEEKPAPVAGPKPKKDDADPPNKDDDESRTSEPQLRLV